MSFIRKYRIELFIFLLALIVRVIFLYVQIAATHGDIIAAVKGDDGFYEISQSIIHGHGFSANIAPPYRPNPLRPPLQPLILSGLFLILGSPLLVIIVHMLISIANIFLAMYLAQKLTNSRQIAVLVGIFFALEPYNILLSNLMYSETIFIFLFFWFLIFLEKTFRYFSYKNLILTAIILDAAILVKPTVEYIPIVIILYILWHQRKNITYHLIARLAVFGAVCLLLLTPWFYRNYKDYGVVGMSAQPAFNLYIYLVPSVLAIHNGTTFSQELLNLKARDHTDEPQITLATSKEFSHRAIEILRHYPLDIAKLSAISWITFFTNDGLLYVFSRLGVPIAVAEGSNIFRLFHAPTAFFGFLTHEVFSPTILIIADRLMWVIITLFFFIGCIQLIRKQMLTPFRWFCLFLVFYFMLTTTINGLGVNARFRMPVDGIIVCIAFYSMAVSVLYIRHRRNRNKIQIP